MRKVGGVRSLMGRMASGCGMDGCGVDGCGVDGCGVDGCGVDGCGESLKVEASGKNAV